MQGKQAELAFVGGTVRTPTGPSGFAQAIAVSGGVIRALGGDEEIRGFAGPVTRGRQVVYGDE